MKIDIVYTWCDGSDPEFQRQRNETCKKIGIPVKSTDDQLDTEKRYQNNDELLYSLRSVEKYAPWINRIFIVTNNQCPAWLNDNSKITLVNQNDILPKEIQPIFNSVAIEQYLTEIPSLSEHFLYFCDDMFLNRAVKPTDFFHDDKPIVWKMPCPEWFDFTVGDWEQTVFNAYRLFLEKRKQYVPFFQTHHGVDAYTKSVLKEIFAVYPESFVLNSTPFRNPQNIQRILWSYEMAYSYGSAVKNDMTGRSDIKSAFAILLRKNAFWNQMYNPAMSDFAFSLRLFLKKPYCFCMNNICGVDTVRAKAYLQKRFPKKSRFEK